ncbi:stage II sporulation protein D [Pseudoflavonifractor sp. MSJ-30]|uniref:stage II sporulation protein D n=1 Tax=Pseudoflavonifractor sp. MSJ-30 TaxID=2841525 RepID=UPI001C111AFE|nr:stage II sporulation protein D [Pseudoflavonifractor sp. MSJ-30]MBU5452905.1 stage II sporulation protein D [Pseudoflavonifractor sp. MSJ-30]
MEKQSSQLRQSILMGLLLPVLLIGGVGNLAEEAEMPSFYTKDSAVSVCLTDGTELALDAYLQRVLLGEMPISFEKEALKAQAVAARTYTAKAMAGGKHGGKLCTDSTCCQAFCDAAAFTSFTPEEREKAADAVRETDALVLTYDGALIEATFFSCSGGRTEDAVAVWGTDYPYLRSVESPGEEAAKYDTDSRLVSKRELETALEITLSDNAASWAGAVQLTSGGGVETIELGGKRFLGVYLRKALGLRSTAFTVTPEGDALRFDTRGYGHRVGLSQYGANAMAADGADFREILRHYYPGTALLNYGEFVEN